MATHIKPLTTVAANQWVTQTFQAIDNKSGQPRVCGGDTFYAFFVSGPERVMPHITDYCNGTYAIHARVAAPGTYAWNVVLEWEHNVGLDEMLGPGASGQHQDALHQSLRPLFFMLPWSVLHAMSVQYRR